MYFTSLNFGLFLLCLFVLYYTVFRRFQWQLLLVAGLVFYAFSGWSNLIYIGVTIFSTWFASRQMANLRSSGKQYLSENPGISKEDRKAHKSAVSAKQRIWLIACLLFNFVILAVVKYTDFAISNVNALFGQQFSPVNFLLPMGISFYTFQSMGYIVDVYRGAEDEPSLFKLGLFVSFFPQLIQGPISRFGDLKKTLFAKHDFNAEQFQTGFARIAWGFFKKLVVADRLLVAVRALASSPDEYSGAYVILTMFFYAVTLYADFTGGIDITIGVAKIFGVEVKENFNRPFYAVSIADYWRRWHISMGTWFKDYLFYSISASRPLLKLFKWSKNTFGDGFGKRVPVYVSTLILWFATGLWHGAEWHFIVWGMANGVVIIISEELSPLYARFHKRFPVGEKLWYRAFQVFRTFWLMSLIRTFDVYANVRLTFKMYWSIVTDFDLTGFISKGIAELGLGAADYGIIAIAVFVMIAAGFVHYNRKVEFLAIKPVWRNVLIAGLIFAVIIFGVYGFGYDSRQFIYNQF